MSKWKTAGTRVHEQDYNALQNAANEKGITIAALMFALLHETTNGFKDFTLHKPMPRGVIVRSFTVATDKE